MNEPDFDHLSFVSVMLSQIIQAGGAQIGDITDFGAAEKPFLIVYARHPEGNVLELEQIWIVWSVYLGGSSDARDIREAHVSQVQSRNSSLRAQFR